MASQEKILLDNILLEAAKLAGQVILFRNNTGLGWQGDIVSQNKFQIVIKNPRPLHAGLIKGSSDLIGFTSIEITPEMVGKTVAVFTAVEGKTITKRKKRVSTSGGQKHFLEKVTDAGGIGIEADDEKECINEIKRAIDEYKAN
jgi:hypothetical protein